MFGMTMGVRPGSRVGIMPLSESNRKVLGFIQGYVQAHGYAPSLREIMEGCGYREASGAFYQVHQLIHLGYLEQMKPGKQRAIAVVEPESVRPRTKALSDKNRAVLRYILQFVDKHGFPPTLGEIARKFQHKHPRTAHKQVIRLIRLGYLERVEGRARGLVIVDPQRAAREVNAV